MSEPEIRCSYTRLVAVGELKPHPKNPNQHPREQLELFAKIIAHQGWRRPIRVSNLSGCITAGHGALAVAKLQGWAEVPVDFQDYASPEDEVADLLADNQLAQLADLDEAGVKGLLAELDDVELAGFFAEEEGDDPADTEPEVAFSEVLNESNNYIVLVFDNDVDWLQAQTHFELQPVMNRRQNGKPHTRGVGRVVNGAAYLNRITA
ncbi:ParB/Srx family N-terminal domain-containing protein [Roseibacillus ishigakijimensis]|uniref:ParB-like N-terminal domain-containing protein n=1 Tax=Roseibacillus ishigakijimensis TaxID=454146 RepID=A0A934RV41_9BACT|nr:ParB/Srx family N-terminal domain-containing protein [Roseibacillus ishigakijimensis]MBK1835026.1 hypothetical protein [Roseibacillus ishigakijimensis]